METIPSQKIEDVLLTRILEKYRECKEKSFLQIAVYHLEIYGKYLKLLQEKGQAAFPNRLEYQKFQIAKLFIDKISLLEFSLDPSLKGFKEYKDSMLAPLDAFSMTSETKEARKVTFLRKIDRGDILHLKVIEILDDEYKLLVLNKYDENERVCDYAIDAYLLKGYITNKLPRRLQINDLIRAAVFGKLKMEGNVFSKLLVTMNDSKVKDEYNDVCLGLVLESDIPFYPKDISNCRSFIDYMISNKNLEDPKDLIKCMSSLGVDPYKTYSFHESGDGKKLGQPQEPSSAVELRKIEESMKLVKETDDRLHAGEDCRSFMPMIEKAIEICPENDCAFAIRGQMYYTIFKKGQGIEVIYFKKALEDFETALSINGYNLTATREYLKIILASVEEFEEEGNVTKTNEIQKIIDKCRDICDMNKLMEQ